MPTSGCADQEATLSNLPIEVVFVRRELSRNADSPLHSLLDLLSDQPETAAMWRSIERNMVRLEPDRPKAWVYEFLWMVHEAMDEPDHHQMNAAGRLELADQIDKLTAKLREILAQNDLDCRLVDLRGHNFSGIYVLDDFSEPNRTRIEDSEQDHIVDATKILEMLAKRSRAKLLAESPKGKSGANAAAIRFARRLSRTISLDGLGNPLNMVVATATNALFETNYEPHHIANLRNQA